MDDIWDQPVLQDSDAEEAPVKPAKRQQQALFIADSDDDEAPGPGHQAQKAPADIDIDIDAMFADDDDLFSMKPLAPAMDTEAVRREAEMRHKNTAPSLTPHQILPSSSPRDMGDGAAGKTKQGGGEEGKESKKERKRPVRLDEGRLLGPAGFPQLIKDTKNFRIKGKGHEAADLDRLLQIYQFWTHGMYPKTRFEDTVERIEKLCHSKRMNVALSVWRDEAHGVVNGKNPEEDDDVIDLTNNEHPADFPKPDKRQLPRSSSPIERWLDTADNASSSSRPPSHPPTSGTEDEFDIELLTSVTEERRERERAAVENGVIGQGNANGKGKVKMVVGQDDDEEAMWRVLDTLEGEHEPTLAKTVPAKITMDDADAMWNELDALSEQVAPVPEKLGSVSKNVDEDEDMWDVVDEMENGLPGKSSATYGVAGAPAPATLDPVPEPDDWDDMYL